MSRTTTSRKKPPTKRTITTKKTKMIPKKNFLKRVRNYIIFSVVMMVIGGSADRYRYQIYEFASGGYKEILAKVSTVTSDITGSTAVKKYYPNADSSKKVEKSKQSKVSSVKPKNNEIVKHKYYTLGYNEDREQPNWVAYKLTKEMILNKKVKRTDNFRIDPYVSTGSAELDDYRKSGYDRGHLCPAAAMAFNQTAMSETFFLSNMSPQKPEFNRGGWKKLERKVRGWAVKKEGISVVTGPIFYDNDHHIEIGNNLVDVPGAYYKIILDYTKPDIKAIGFILPNRKITKPLSDYVVPVDEVERITRLNFFASLPDNIEKLVESRSDYNKWN